MANPNLRALAISVVPDLHGKTVTEARDVLTKSGLQLGKIGRLQAHQQTGTVVRQSPAASQTATRGSSVNIWIAEASLVKAPDLVGRPVAYAESVLAKSDLKLEQVGRMASDYPEGTVARQSPLANEVVRRGSAVRVWISAARPVNPDLVIVPDLAKRRVKEAAAILTKAGLRLGDVSLLPSNAPIGTVLDQSPSPHRAVARNTRVDVWIAQGPLPSVPDVIGRTLKDAYTILARSGLSLQEAGRIESKYPEGTVARQSPPAGGEAAKGAAVRVWVSVAAMARVPDLRGLSVAAADQSVRKDRLTLGTQTLRPSLPPAGLVLEQKPTPGVELEVGHPVDVTVGDGTQARVPALVGQTERAALERLKAANLRPGDRGIEESGRPGGEVLRQQPTAGSVVDRGGGVAYWVATPATVAVPKLIGLREDEALERLKPLGLAGGSSGTEESARPEGEIVRQEPASGTRVLRGQRVGFWVAPPARVLVPELVGVDARDARARLSALALLMVERPSEKNDAPKGTIIAHEPAAGTPVPRGSEIAVSVSAGPPSVSPLILGGGIGAALLAVGAGLWWARRVTRVPIPPPTAKPTLRVHMGEPDASVVGLALDPAAPLVRVRTRLVAGDSDVSAEKLVVREERRES